VYSSRLVDVQARHAKTLQNLRNKISSLRSETEDRIRFTETQTDYSFTKVLPAKLKTNIEGILKEMVGHETTLEELEEDMALLKRRFESLKVRSKK
jgi:vacuolar-type H+-ATPase subunit E/Vma4